MPSYRAYGLRINSELHLPELSTGSAVDADVTIRLGDVRSPEASAIDADDYVRIEESDAYCRWSRVGVFQVCGGREIVVDPAPGSDPGYVRLVLLGAIMAILLHQRGFLVLHASAAAVDGRAVVVLGGKGEGKSTLAATLCGQGHGLLADDIVAVAFDAAGCPSVLPGFPQLRLWPDAAKVSFGDEPESLPRLFASYDKRARRADQPFVDRALPIGGIFSLSEGSTITLVSLRAHDAVIQLIQHSYLARFGPPALRSGDAARRHLYQCTLLARGAPVYRLHRPRALSLLGETARLVASQVRTRHELTEALIP